MVNKRKAIVDATIRRIAEMGSSFSTGQIAFDVGCSQSLIFRYYETKEKLMSECFDAVCHELRLILQAVGVPQVLTRDSINRYMIGMWEAYSRYLESNSHIAKAYLYFISTGRRFPHGYKSAETVLKRILRDDYDRIVRAYPDFTFMAEYIVMMANVSATGQFIDWNKDPKAVGKLDGILKYGILGTGQVIE